jgi:hypothetical protein
MLLPFMQKALLNKIIVISELKFLVKKENKTNRAQNEV